MLRRCPVCTPVAGWLLPQEQVVVAPQCTCTRAWHLSHSRTL